MRMLITCLLLFCFSNMAFSQDQDFELAEEYFSQAEYEKAASLYAKLAKKESNYKVIYKNYLTCLEKSNAQDEAEKFFKKLLKFDPKNPEYNISYGFFVKNNGQESQAQSLWANYLKENSTDLIKIRTAARMLFTEKEYAQAELYYVAGNKVAPGDFDRDLAELYFLTGEKKKMIARYLAMLDAHDDALILVQNGLQVRLADEKDFDLLEESLFELVEKRPDKIVYNKMLVWIYLQQKNFAAAFIQAKAIDKRNEKQGEYYKIGQASMEIGQLALTYNAYEQALEIFTFVADKYKNKPVYYEAKNFMLQTQELIVKNSFPIKKEQINQLAFQYQKTIDEIGIRTGHEAVRKYALLQAFYMDNPDTAVLILNKLLSTPAIAKNTISLAKIDLADVYLLKNDPWEASLLYSQVEKAEPDNTIGHQAKLKNAKVCFYNAEFDLAKKHLDILKMATSREIANDAMQLALVIQDNWELDTSDLALKTFAEIDLLVFRGQFEQAIKGYDKMLKDFPRHSLTDDIIYAKAQIYMRLRKYDMVLLELKTILTNHGTDLYGDDACFQIAQIYDNFLVDKKQAMAFYEKIIFEYPSSVHNVEATKRYRKLRGEQL